MPAPVPLALALVDAAIAGLAAIRASLAGTAPAPAGGGPAPKAPPPREAGEPDPAPPARPEATAPVSRHAHRMLALLRDGPLTAAQMWKLLRAAGPIIPYPAIGYCLKRSPWFARVDPSHRRSPWHLTDSGRQALEANPAPPA